MQASHDDWFSEARFGLFLHWGLYSLEGVHEQDQWRCQIPREKYADRVKHFYAPRFDPDEWVEFAQSIGAGYLVITAKHHDGFCLWDSALTDFTSMQTPARKDFIGALADACHKKGMPFGIYYSVVDWKHPQYPNEGRHHELPPQPQDKPNWEEYLKYLEGQCHELCNNYGKLAIWWWDMNVPEAKVPEINASVRKWQPGILINNRGFDEGDFKTPEREKFGLSGELKIYRERTEACESISPQAWCYRKDDALYHSNYLIRNLSTHLAKGGNYLLNMGPTGDGSLPPRECERIAEVGKWFKLAKEALSAKPVSDEFSGIKGLVTRRGKMLYILLIDPPTGDALEVTPLEIAPQSVCLMNDNSTLQAKVEWLPMRFHKQPSSVLRVHGLPSTLPDGKPLILKLEFTTEPIGEKDNPSQAEIL